MRFIKFVRFSWLLLLLCPLMLQAQSNYKPGYVVNLEGDTIRGFINYREWVVNPAVISLRKAPDNSASEKTFDVKSARYFEVTGKEAYQRYEGMITMNPVDLESLSFYSNTLVEPVEVFLRISYQGEFVHLLTYTDQVKTRLFYQQKEESEPRELYYNRFYVASDSKQIVEQKGYVGQLLHLANIYDVSAARLIRNIKAAHYSENELIAIMAQLNEQRVTAPAYKPLNSKPSRFYAGLALNASTVRMRGVRKLDENNTNPVSWMPSLTIGYDAFLNKDIQKLYFRAEVSLTAAEYLVQNVVNIGSDRFQQAYNIAYQNLIFSPHVIYSIYNRDDLKWNVGVTGQLNLTHYSTNRFTVQATYGTRHDPAAPHEVSNTYDNLMKFMPYWISYGTQTGVVLNKKYEVFVAYSPYATASQVNKSSIAFRSMYFGVNYMVNEK